MPLFAHLADRVSKRKHSDLLSNVVIRPEETLSRLAIFQTDRTTVTDYRKETTSEVDTRRVC